MYNPNSSGEGQANAAKNHAVYPFAAYNCTPLTPTLLSELDPKHLAEFERSAIDPSLAQLNFQSFDGYHAFTTFLNECEFDQKDRINTGCLRQYWLEKYDHLYQGFWAVWGINIFTGESEINQAKPNQPRLSNVGEIIKYETPRGKGTPYIYLNLTGNLLRKIAKRYKKRHLLPPAMIINQEWTPLDKWKWIKEHNIPIFLTEGAKKAACLISHGYAAIACFSITTHSQKKQEDESVWFTPLKPEILWLLENNSKKNKRDIYITFDRADTKLKSRLAVNQQTKILGHKLEKHHCNVKVVEWDDFSCKGIDDYAYKHGLKGIRKIIKEATPLGQFRAKLRAKKSRKLNSDLVIDTRYLSHEDLESAYQERKKAIFIKSQQNTGKTQAIADFLEKYQISGKKTLGFTHRQALARDSASRLGLDCYLDKYSIDVVFWALFGIMICVDSIFKIGLNFDFHFGVIDECEQVAWHIISSFTDIKYNRADKIERIAYWGKNIISNDGFLIMADADLSNLSVRFYGDLFGLKPGDILVIDNQYKPFEGRRDAIFYEDPETLKAETTKLLKQAQRVLFHTSGQKEGSTHGSINLEKYYRELFPHKNII